jgi:hypothetical protein
MFPLPLLLPQRQHLFHLIPSRLMLMPMPMPTEPRSDANLRNNCHEVLEDDAVIHQSVAKVLSAPFLRLKMRTVRTESLCKENNYVSSVRLFCELPSGLYKVQKELLAFVCYSSSDGSNSFNLSSRYNWVSNSRIDSRCTDYSGFHSCGSLRGQILAYLNVLSRQLPTTQIGTSCTSTNVPEHSGRERLENDRDVLDIPYGRAGILIESMMLRRMHYQAGCR